MGKLTQNVTKISEADFLRELLDDCEKILASLDTAGVKQLLSKMSEASRMLDSLAAGGFDIRGESARFTTIEERIVRYARQIVKLAGGRDAFVAYRSKTMPHTEQRFWMLDKEISRLNQQILRQLGIYAAIIVVILVAGYIARPVLFPPDPVGDAVTLASRALYDSDPDAAFQAIDDGLAQKPESVDLWIWRGYLLESRDDSIGSQEAYDQALLFAGSDKDFLLLRAMIFVRLGDSERVLTDTNLLIERYPDFAEAYYVRASGYEGTGATLEAIDDLEKCGELAQNEGNETLFAQARVRMATLMQALR